MCLLRILFVQGHLHVVWLLLLAGFDATEVDDVGNNALMYVFAAQITHYGVPHSSSEISRGHSSALLVHYT